MKILKSIILGIILVTGMFFTFNRYIYVQKQTKPDTIDSYRGTLTGTFTCLPRKNTRPPQSSQCAYGMRTDSGEYYALDLGMSSIEIPPLAQEQRFAAAGLITPIEMLSSDRWKEFNVEGIFSVTDSFRKL